MSLDEIKNYFLSAGASYRKSREWKEMFTNEKGKSKVQRNGRFGIGVLAAFLIGKNISIITKKINSDFGYSFEANLNMDQINISKKNIIDIGTTITIEINEDVFEILSSNKRTYDENVLWTDWYTLSKPKLNISFLGDEIVTYENFDPHYLDTIIPNDWNYLDAKGYNKILWTYSDDYSGRDLVCNGIAIPIEDARYNEKKIIDVGLFSKKPKISIFDNDGVTPPLTLNRNNLSENLDFHEELKKSIYKDYIAYLLTFKDISFVKNNTIKIKDQSLSFPGVAHYYNSNRNEMVTQFGESNYYKGSHLLRETLISKKVI
ncbi:hypothetical protein JCM19275_1593 [Nonlabens ulvanivorans]|uniref:Uncharacterized protein n=1 Tax=Nonlabens ulvanivorans TaxID=906888 RepID=A0A090WFA7_NONUL|nr:hypothetical protein [Nonlabens ulvanivorans]GAL75710.1 hypothetical protein JCM19275_1593 [Nonlabens ulvanivorans]